MAASKDLATSTCKRPIRPILSAPAIAPAALRPPTNAGAWKAPEDWAVSPTESALSGAGTEDINDAAATDHLASLTLDLAHMERETDHMRDASPQVILRRLKDDCNGKDAGAVPETGPDDGHEKATRANIASAACHDREMEKQRWLLSALYNMESVWDTNEEGPKPAMKPVAQKILALFESQGSSSLSPSLTCLQC